MKRKALSLIALSLAGIALVAGGITFGKSSKRAAVTFATYTNGDAAVYYSSIDESKSGNDLLKDLRSLNLSKRQSTVGYSSMGTSPSGQFKYTDYDPNYVQYDSNGQPYGTRISSFYTYTSATSWNREHVWPNSHGGGSGGDAGTPYPDADIHMPRPTISSENSSRGNSFFVEGMNHSSSGWDPYKAGYSAESRGEAARITFYCTLVNAKLNLAPNNTSPSGTDPVTGTSYGSGHTMGNLETLIKWNIDYPVTQREKNRNEGAEYLQGNRNAFVDHPEYACKIWGNVNNNIKNMCASANWDSGAGVSISKAVANLVVDDTTTISATSSDGSAISWSTSDSQVVTVSNSPTGSGANTTLTAVGPGTATITATATIESTAYTATCAVTVTSSGGGGVTPDTDSYSILPNDLDSGYPTTAKSYTADSGIGFTAYYTANFSSKVQLKKGQGYLYNNDALTLGTLTLNNLSGSVTVYAGTTKNPSSTTVAGSNGVYNLKGYSYFKIVATSGSVVTCSSINVGLDTSSSSTKTLSSIELSNITDNYTVGDTFVKPTITAVYNDSSEKDVTSSATCSGYNMNTSGQQTVNVSYTEEGITRTTSYQITVSKSSQITSISATAIGTFEVGETITRDDIVVQNSNGETISEFTFNYDNYQFTYQDAASGGALTNKTFTNAVTSATLSCDLTVQVKRVARVDPATSTISLNSSSVFNKIGGTSSNLQSGNVTFEGISYEYYKAYYYSSGKSLSFGNASSQTGYVRNQTPFASGISDITASSSGRKINIKYSVDGSDWTSASEATPETIIYKYFRLDCVGNSGSNYSNITLITISLYGKETPLNLSNYIMFEDTNGQCVSKLDIAIGYLSSMDSDGRSTFASSDDYVISKARERLEAWALNQDKVIDYDSGELSNKSNLISHGNEGSNSSLTIIIVVSSLSVTSLTLLLILKKKRLHN